MALDTVGILTPIDFAAEQPTVLAAIWRQVFVNETPLYSRLPHVQATSQSYTINRYEVRQRDYAVGAGGITAAATALPIADASAFQVGDVLDINDGTNRERVEVLAPPTLTATPNTLTVRRAREGTTAFAFAAGVTARLVGNSRTGGEIDQQAFRTVVTGLQQIVQTFQFSVQVGGLANAVQNVALPPGANDVMGRDRAIKLVEAVRDVENTFYYGLGELPAATGDRAKSKGLRSLISSYNAGANVRTGVGASYTFTAFINDTFTRIYAAGGMPDTVLCSTDFAAGIFTWAPNKTAIMGGGTLGTNALGLPIRGITMPMGALEMTFVPSLQLRPGTAVVLSSADLDVRFIRELYWQPRERRGDAMEGDWIGDYCINLSRPQYHAWIEGVTGFA